MDKMSRTITDESIKRDLFQSQKILLNKYFLLGYQEGIRDLEYACEYEKEVVELADGLLQRANNELKELPT